MSQVHVQPSHIRTYREPIKKRAKFGLPLILSLYLLVATASVQSASNVRATYQWYHSSKTNGT